MTPEKYKEWMDEEEYRRFKEGYETAIEDVVLALRSYTFPFGQDTIDSFIVIIKELNHDQSS